MNKYRVDIDLTSFTYYVEASTEETAKELAYKAALTWLMDYDAEIEQITANEENDWINDADIELSEREEVAA